MNRPKKITLTLLGIAASVGLGSLIASPMHRERAQRTPGIIKPSDEGWRPTPCEKCGQWYKAWVKEEELKHQHLTPSPEPKKPLQEGYERVKCEKCGQEYTQPLDPTLPTVEMMYHRHPTPQQWSRNQCKKCGEVYYLLLSDGDPNDGCVPIREELKHLHLDKEEIFICRLGPGSETKK